MGNIQRLAITRMANFVTNKNANRDVVRKCIVFREKLKLKLLVLDKAIKWGNQRFSRYLAGNLMVLLFFGLPLGILKSAHAHTRALNINSQLGWR